MIESEISRAMLLLKALGSFLAPLSFRWLLRVLGIPWHVDTSSSLCLCHHMSFPCVAVCFVSSHVFVFMYPNCPGFVRSLVIALMSILTQYDLIFISLHLQRPCCQISHYHGLLIIMNFVGGGTHSIHPNTDIDWHCIESVDQFGKHWHLNNNELCDPETIAFPLF